MPRILVAGDQPLIRSALRALLSSLGLNVTGDCANDPAAVAAAVRNRPDVVVIDFDLDGRCAAAPQQLVQILRASQGCPVLIVTSTQSAKALTCALQHGVLGVVMKTRSAEVLVRAVRAVAAGEAWLERSSMVNVFQTSATPTDIECQLPVARDKLTRREAEIVELVSLGLQNKKIAERLFISETTVRHHLTSIYDKLSVTNRLELMRYTYSAGNAAVA